MGDFGGMFSGRSLDMRRLGFTPMGDFCALFSGRFLDVRGFGSHLWEILVACSLRSLWT